MKRSSAVIVGSVLAALMLACTDGPGDEEVEVSGPADYSEVCVDGQMTIFPEDECENGSDGRAFIYIPGGTYVGAHGSRYNGVYDVTKPPGNIGRVPATGGFGTYTTRAGR